MYVQTLKSKETIRTTSLVGYYMYWLETAEALSIAKI